MRYKLFAIAVCVSVALVAMGNLAYLQTNPVPLRLIVKSDKKEYFEGEVVNLTFELKNVSEKDAFVSNVFGVGSGALTVHISKDGKSFPEYNPGWGQVDFASSSKTIKPGESIYSTSTVFWHRKPNALKDEKEERIREIGEKTLVSSYAFPEPGTYYVKAIYDDVIESSPISITIKEPSAEELEAWNVIKNNDWMGFFIQMGYLPESKTIGREKKIAEVEALISKYPNSSYAESLRRSLGKFNENEKKREESKKKLAQTGN